MSGIDKIIEKYITPCPNIEEWSNEYLQRFHEDALKNILNFAYNNNTFYRQKMDNIKIHPKDFNNLDDISKFPLINKDELRGNPWVLLCVPKERLSQIHASTGTTGGEPSYVSYTKKDLYDYDLSPISPSGIMVTY